MLPAALLRQRAELEQTGAEASVFTLPAPQTEPEADSAIALEATRLGALAAEFGLFGMHIALDLEAFWDASAPYRPSTRPKRRQPTTPTQRPARSHFRKAWRGGCTFTAMPARACTGARLGRGRLLAAQFAALWGAGAGLLELPLGASGAFVVRRAFAEGWPLADRELSLHPSPHAP
jgi:hypothetical protein